MRFLHLGRLRHGLPHRLTGWAVWANRDADVRVHARPVREIDGSSYNLIESEQ